MGTGSRTVFAIILVAVALAACLTTVQAGRRRSRLSKSGSNSSSVGNNREQKLFSVFQIVSFPNDPCSGSGTSNGTCYTSEECLSRGGSKSGDCAEGFGVCCIFTVGCGSSSSENCTYFTVSSASAGECKTTICPCGDNICQLRLDFNTFTITGPSTVTTSAFTTNNGQPTSTNAKNTGLSSRCLTDSFSVTNPDGSAPPVICGTNNGEHMYVDSATACNDLAFQLGTSTSATTRTWNIKVTQYSCNYDNLAPSGCTQYFFGSNTGTVQTYNYNSGNGRHLAFQCQAQCFRRERGNCRLCMSRTTATDFVVSGPTTTNANSAPTMCCQYGTNGQVTEGYDCLIIPNAMDNANALQPSRICGETMGSTRCTTQYPFHIRFVSDGFEFAGANTMEASNNNIGYMLGYFMDNTNC